MVPRATFESYYGTPIINAPVWSPVDVPAYLFLGGMAGSASVLGFGAGLTDRPGLARTTKLGSALAIGASAGLLVHDLGRPARFLNMLRVVKPTSPMSVGSWLLSAFGPLTAAAAMSELSGRMRRVGLVASAGAAVVGPAVGAYTGALLANTAVPAWHEGHRELPFVFVGSGATAAAGLGLLGAPLRENAPARRLAVVGAASELLAVKLMERRMGMVDEAYKTGRSAVLLRFGQALTFAGLCGAVAAGSRSRKVAAASGTALMAASACTRWGIFMGGMQSANDPRYTVIPQRRRMQERHGGHAESEPG